MNTWKSHRITLIGQKVWGPCLDRSFDFMSVKCIKSIVIRSNECIFKLFLYGYFIISWLKDEEKERGIKREESKDDDDNEDGSSNNNADEYDPLEAEDADDYDDDGRGPAACTWFWIKV